MCCHHLRIQFVSLSRVFFSILSFFFSPLLAFSSFPLLFPSPLLPLSPHLMRPHNNTAVVQLFCYLSQTAGSLHSVFLVPFACLLRQGNEYHLEVQSSSSRKGWSVISGYTSEVFARGAQTSNQSISSIMDVSCISTAVQCEYVWNMPKSIAIVNSLLALCCYGMTMTPWPPHFKQDGLFPRRRVWSWYNSVWGQLSPRSDK